MLLASVLNALDAVEITRTDRGRRIEFPLPGFKKDQVNIELETGLPARLLVSARHGDRAFHRTLTLDEQVDFDAVGASLEDGILTIDLPDRPRPVRTVTIK